jgi:hypothetical protein
VIGRIGCVLVLAAGALWGCSSEPGAECQQVDIFDSGQASLDGATCDCGSGSSADQICPGPLDSYMADSTAEVATLDDTYTLTDAHPVDGGPYPLEVSIGDGWYDGMWPGESWVYDGWYGETWANDGWYGETWALDGWYVEGSYGDNWYGEDGDGCCSPSNPCDWADDGWCDCGGIYEWDLHDCQGWSGDVYYFEDVYCEEGCSYYDVTVDGGEYDAQYNCCSEWDPCNWANDGMCDCKGMFGWDSQDCI